MASLFSSLLPAHLTRPRLQSRSLTFTSTTSKPRKVIIPLCYKSKYKPKGNSTPTRKATTTTQKHRHHNLDPPICPGCGILMQDKDPNLPGYYQHKELKHTKLDQCDDGFPSKSNLSQNLSIHAAAADPSEEEEEEEEDEYQDEEEEEYQDEEDGDDDMDWNTIIDGKKMDFDVETLPTKFDQYDDGFLSKSNLFEDLSISAHDDDPPKEEKDEQAEEEEEEEEDGDGDMDWDIVIDGKKINFDIDSFPDEEEERRLRKELDGFGPAGAGYGSVTEETIAKMKKEKLSKSARKKKAREEVAKKAAEDNSAVVCARCHSLRHYNDVKNQKADNLIPDFDFDRLVVSSLMRPTSTSPVVVIVVDCVDFDGSFPKNAVKSLFKALEPEDRRHVKLSKSPKIVLVATKVDLLPSRVSPARLDKWVRSRAKAWRAPKLSGVYIVSARKDLGVRNLLGFIKEVSGPRSNVWVVGAQNVGKSTLINALARKEGAEVTRLTEAAVPGTTVGVVRIGNVLPAKAKMFDTPGLLHPYLLSMRLSREEQKMVEIRKELRPRSFRVKTGQTVHLGGLARLDVARSSVETIYVTVFASQCISLHLGKTENADEIWKTHVGVRLQPPVGQDRLSKLGQWGPKEMKLKGVSWEVNSADIAISGLGWFSFGLKGEATVLLWTFDGVEITKRDPLVLDRAQFLERPGFLLPNAISDAIGNQSKRSAQAKKAHPRDFLLEEQ